VFFYVTLMKPITRLYFVSQTLRAAVGVGIGVGLSG
jgi:hypothetical protein